MKRTNLLRIILMLLAVVLVAMPASAQRKKSRARKAKTSKRKTVKKQEPLVAVPLDSLVGRSYSGEVGQTVVDFFGTRKTYGAVHHDIYVYSPTQLVYHYYAGDTDSLLIRPYQYSGCLLTMGPFTYQALDNGHSLQLQKTKEKGEDRQGKLLLTDPKPIIDATYRRGNYIDRSGDLTDEERKESLTMIQVAADAGHDEARTYLRTIRTREAEAGDEAAIGWLIQQDIAAGNYSDARKWIDKEAKRHPDDPRWLCDKGSVYLAEGNTSAAKKLLKQIKKLDADYYNSAEHPFLQAMKGKKK